MNDPDEHRILLRMRDGADRRLLAEWLANQTNYTPVVADSNDAIDEAFDLCVVDTATIEDAGSALEARRRMEPTFLPCLLMVPERTGASSDEVLANLSKPGSMVVDEVLTTPVQKRALSQRLGTLFRMRELSQRLNDSRNRYHRLLEVMPEGVLVMRDGAIEYVNESCLSLLNAEEQELLGTGVLDVVAADQRGQVGEHLRRIEEGERPGFVETTLQATDGETVPVEVGGVRLVDDTSGASVQVVIRDLTGRKGRERRLSVLDSALEHTLGNRVDEIVDHAAALERDADDEAVQERAAEIRELTDEVQSVVEGTDRLDAVIGQGVTDDSICDLTTVVESAVGDRTGHETAVYADVADEAIEVRPRGCAELAVEELLDEALEEGSAPVQVHVEGDETTAELRLTEAGHSFSLPLSSVEPLVGSDVSPGDSPGAVDLWLVRWAVETAGGEVAVESAPDGRRETVVRLPRADTGESTDNSPSVE